MKHLLTKNRVKKMNINLASSLLIVVLMIASLGGATHAWFNASKTLENVFTAGTVIISDPIVVPSIATRCVPTEKCQEITWEFENIGSKRAYVRVKPEARVEVYPNIYIAIHMEVNCETAWVGVRNPGNDLPYKRFPTGNFSQYFEYPLGRYTVNDPLELLIVYGSTYVPIGFANIWEENNKLYIRLVITDKKYTTDTIHIYAGVEEPFNPAPGKLGWTFERPYSDPFEMNTAVIFDMQGGTANVLISDLYASSTTVNVELCDLSIGKWYPINGNLEENEIWWYYGDVSGPTIVMPGDKVSVCFKFCVVTTGDITLSASLEAEAVQMTNGAINVIWPNHPWGYLPPQQ